MFSEVDIISVHQEHKLESGFHKDSKRHTYQNGRGYRLRHTIEFPQFNASPQTTWATAANHVHALQLWQMWSKTLCRTDLQAGGSECVLQDNGPADIQSNQESRSMKERQR